MNRELYDLLNGVAHEIDQERAFENDEQRLFALACESMRAYLACVEIGRMRDAQMIRPNARKLTFEELFDAHALAQPMLPQRQFIEGMQAVQENLEGDYTIDERKLHERRREIEGLVDMVNDRK